MTAVLSSAPPKARTRVVLGAQLTQVTRGEWATPDGQFICYHDGDRGWAIMRADGADAYFGTLARVGDEMVPAVQPCAHLPTLRRCVMRLRQCGHLPQSDETLAALAAFDNARPQPPEPPCL